MTRRFLRQILCIDYGIEQPTNIREHCEIFQPQTTFGDPGEISAGRSSMSPTQRFRESISNEAELVLSRRFDHEMSCPARALGLSLELVKQIFLRYFQYQRAGGWYSGCTVDMQSTELVTKFAKDLLIVALLREGQSEANTEIQKRVYIVKQGWSQQEAEHRVPPLSNKKHGTYETGFVKWSLQTTRLRHLITRSIIALS